MSRATCLLTALTIAAGCTTRSPEQQIVEDAAEALGGRDRILAIRTLTIEGEGTNGNLGQDMTPVFNQYLRRTELPTLELAFKESEGTVAYRWKADERDFAMPIRVGERGKWTVIQPTTGWAVMKTPLKKDAFEVATDLYYVNVTKQ